MIINKRYNDDKITLFTTNFSDHAAAGDRAARDLTLSGRIGATLRSRLDEMCRVIEVPGPDYRHKVRQANYSW